MRPEPDGSTPGPADEELVARITPTDAEPLAALFDRHSAAAYGLALRMVGPDGAEDVVQDSFLGLWRSAARYQRGRGSVRAWLLGIVHNRSIDALRAGRKRERRRAGIEHIEERLDGGQALEDDLVRREQGGEVRDALSDLPVDQRRVLLLAYFGGLTQAEIAEELDVPVGTVKGRARLGLAKLRDALEAGERAPRDLRAV